MSNDQLKVGVIGAGWHGLKHVKSYLSYPNADLVAVCDLDEDLLDEVTEEYDIPNGFTDYQDMLAETDIEALSIIVPDYLHLEPTLAAAEAGKHILLEKPMATSVSEAEQMVEAAEKAGVNIKVNFANRWQLPTVQAKESLDNGELGDPLYAYLRMHNPIDVPSERLTWLENSALPHWLLTHGIDRVRWFFDSEATKVRAVSSSGVLEDMGFDTPDLYQATVEFENGAVGNFEASWILPETRPQVGGATFELICTEGWVEVDNFKPMLKKSTPEKYSESSCLGGEIYGKASGTVYESVRHFVDNIRAGSPTRVTAKDGLEVTKIACAIVDSAERDEEIELRR